MWTGPEVIAALQRVGVTHVVWLPDSELGVWNAALSESDSLSLIRVCREGEAFAIAAGLLLAGKRPIIMIQCTGLFEAGDALRNVVHDLKLPLFVLVGVRSLVAHRQCKSADSCPVYTEPILKAWNIPYRLFDERHGVDELARAYTDAWQSGRAAAALLAE